MRLAKHKDLRKPMPECGFHFRFPSYLFQKDKHYDKDDLPIHLRVSPDKLMNLCATVLNKQTKLPECYAWTVDEVITWLQSLGYPEYEETFRINHINGHRLLLLDTKTMLQMSIKDFSHIKQIYHGILYLFHDVGLDSKYFQNRLYRLHLSRTGKLYENLRKTDFLIQNCINEALEDDWSLLHKHLNSLNEKKYDVLIGNNRKSSKHGSVVVQLNAEATSESSILYDPYESLNDSDL